MKNIDFKNKRVLVRVDYNVPLDKNHLITDDTRILRSIPTLKYILENGGQLILMSHLGRPQKKKLVDGSINVAKYSLKYLVGTISEYLERPVLFADDCVGEDIVEMSNNLGSQVLLLENTRFYSEEKEGNENFAKELSKLGDVFINDAFGAAHRAHASTAVVANFFTKEQKGIGFLIQSELENAELLLNNPKRPFTAIVGGAKVSDKMLLLDRLLDKVDNLIIGGGMAYTFVKANGGEIGKSLVELDYLELALKLQKKAKDKGVKLLLPIDTIVADGFNPNANTKVQPTNAISDDWEGLDVGPESIESFKGTILASKSILWNGPLGVFEFDKFAVGTFSIAEAVATATGNGAFSLIGGGDSVAAINKVGLSEEVSFMSTGGGAMLELLEGKELPGIKAVVG